MHSSRQLPTASHLAGSHTLLPAPRNCLPAMPLDYHTMAGTPSIPEPVFLLRKGDCAGTPLADLVAAMTAPLRVWRRQHNWLGPLWHWRCRVCRTTNYWAYDSHTAAFQSARDHLHTHTPVLRDTTGWVALLGPAAVWCPLCDQRIANGIAEDEARHVAAEHWQWHLEGIA